MNTAGRYILIVDDNLKNLEVTAKILKDEGYLISLAESAASALTQLEELIPDLILLDIMMPGMDGLELCRLLKKNERLSDIPVIFLTAKTETEDLTEGFRSGGVDYISKPFSKEELVLRVKNHLELSIARKEVIEMNRVRDNLYSIIAHDIKTPLANITLTLDTLNEGYIDSSSAEFREVLEELGKMTRETFTLLENLLEFTRIQTKGISFSPKQAALFPVVLECIQLFKGNADKKNISINYDIPEDTTAYFDETTIHAVIRNVIFNSIKFTSADGTINIKTSLTDNFVILSIKDTGVGMPEEIIKKIFVNNEHYTTRGTKKEKGSGLGTFIIKDFVKRNGGKVEVESVQGTGTEVKIYLPVNIITG
jgi:two-component system, sensor histidine kinase and response regulator